MLHRKLLQAGDEVNYKRIHPLCGGLRKTLRRKKRNRVAQANRRPRVVNPMWATELCSIDFKSDTLASGRIFRTLNVIDDATMESLAFEGDSPVTGARVIRALDHIGSMRPIPRRTADNNGPEFTGQALDRLAYLNSV